jgi:2-keto-3-deoxy-6-phosphogluconate aldolase
VCSKDKLNTLRGDPVGKRNKNSSLDPDVLNVILEKVTERKSISPDWLASTAIFEDWNTGYTLIQAVSGNMSAAESMQQIVMPNAQVKIMIPGGVEILDDAGNWQKGEGDRPGRAWMIALLKTLIANSNYNASLRGQ